MAQNKMGDIYNNQGIITQGQTGNNTIIQGPVRLAFKQEIAEELVRRLARGKTIKLRAVGGNADQAIANQYQEYLQRQGFQVERSIIGMTSPPPDAPIAVSPDGTTVLIAPSAR